MRFLDTNVLIRFLAADDPAKSEACKRLFDGVAAGREEVMISESVFTEVVYVMSSPSLYSLSHGEIAERLRAIISLGSLQLAGKAAYLRALDLYAEHSFLSIEDALSVAHMERQGISEIVSYDRDFDRVPGIARLEPWALKS